MRVRTPDLIARDDELEELRAAVESARSGQSGAVLVCGPAGVGKTRLVEESIRRFKQGDDLVLVGHCVDLYGEEIPYAAVAEALRHLVRERGVDDARRLLGPAARPLGVLAPALADGGTDEPEAATRLRGEAGVQVLQEFVSGLDHAAQGAGRLVWLWLEDLQWADRATRTLVSYLLRVDGPPQLLVTATVRTEDPAAPVAGEVVAELLRIPHVDELGLKPFTRSQVAEHLRALTGSRPGGGVSDAVALLSGGLPFYTELLAREGLPGGVPGDRVPGAVRSMVRGEVEGLAADARSIVEAASVESGRLPHDVLVEVGGGGDRALAAIAAAVAASVLVPEDDGSGYRFRHALLRESVEAGLLPADRRKWHARWAEQLESTAESTGDRFARIAAAHHWAGSGDRTRAFDAVLSGAALAGLVAADADAVGLAVRALELWPSVPDAADRAGIDQDSLFRITLYWTDQAERPDLAQALGRMQLTGGPNEIRDLVLAYRRREFDGVGWKPTVEEVDLLCSCPLSNPWLSRAAAVASFCLREVDPEAALVLAERAVQAAELTAKEFQKSGRQPALKWMTPEEELLFAEYCRADTMFRVAGDPEGAARIYAAMKPRGEAVSPHIGIRCDACLADALTALGHYRHAHGTATAALAKLPQPRQSPGLYMDLSYAAAEAEIAVGDWDRALARLDEACRRLDDDGLTFRLQALAGLLHCWRGDLETAHRDATVARSYLDTDDEAWLTWETVWLEAELAATRSDADGVRTTCRALWAKPHPETASFALWRPLMTAVKVNVDDISGHPARTTRNAREDLETCRAVAAKLHRMGDIGTAWDLHVTAELSRLDGSADPGAWEAAAEAWVAAGWKRERLLALLGLAAASARVGSDDNAREALTKARDIARRLKAPPLEQAADEIYRYAGLGAGVRARRTSGVDVLTAREREVLALVARGYSNNKIADALFISPKTASVHVSNILAKLHATSRTEAVAVAQRAHLLETP